MAFQTKTGHVYCFHIRKEDSFILPNEIKGAFKEIKFLFSFDIKKKKQPSFICIAFKISYEITRSIWAG